MNLYYYVFAVGPFVAMDDRDVRFEGCVGGFVDFYDGTSADLRRMICQAMQRVYGPERHISLEDSCAFHVKSTPIVQGKFTNKIMGLDVKHYVMTFHDLVAEVCEHDPTVRDLVRLRCEQQLKELDEKQQELSNKRLKLVDKYERLQKDHSL
jgi:hemerythrin-like domain-containing protein